MKFTEKKRVAVFLDPELVKEIDDIRWLTRRSKNNIMATALKIGIDAVKKDLDGQP